MEFDEVKAEHFSSISRNPFPHVLIDRALLQIGGANGAQFRIEALAAAGWTHSNLVPFSKHPDQACAAFNKLRVAMQGNEDAASVIAALKGG